MLSLERPDRCPKVEKVSGSQFTIYQLSVAAATTVAVCCRRLLSPFAVAICCCY